MKTKDNLLSIKDIGKLRGVSSQTLRFYDQIGIFKPDYVNPETGYRYYDPEQYEKLGTILELRQLNFSLDEIREFFSDRNLTKSADMLVKHYNELKKEIAVKQQLADKICEKLDFIEKINKGGIKEKEFIIKDFSTRYAIIGNRNAEIETSMSFMHLESKLNETAPIIASDRMGFYLSYSDIAQVFDMENWKSMILCDKQMENDFHFCEIVKGKYLCAYFRDYKADRDYFLTHFVEYAKFHEIELDGIMIQQFIIDVTLTDRSSETVFEIQAKIKE